MDLLRGAAAAEREVRRLESEGVLLWIPIPAVSELWEGVGRADGPEEERRIDAVLGDYTVLAFERRHPRGRTGCPGALLRRGTMLDPLDAQIAGMALEERLPVLTRNERGSECEMSNT